MARLKDVASLAGVDISTVSKVLQGGNIRVAAETRQRIEAAAKELNYRPNSLARSLRKGRSGAVALALRSTSNYVYPAIIDGAQEAADEQNYCLFLVKYSQGDGSDPLISLAEQGRIDGILIADELPSPTFLEDLEEHEVPYVSLNPFGDTPRPYVALDDAAGFKLQGTYLAGLGHTRIGFVAVAPSSYLSEFCQNAFQQGLASAGLQMDPHLIFKCDFEGNEVDRVANEIALMDERPTALATASVVVAARLADALRRRSIAVPEAVSIVGYHDTPTAAWSEITTVKMPSRQQGYLGIKRLLEVVGGKKLTGEIVAAPPEVVERGSCVRLLRN